MSELHEVAGELCFALVLALAGLLVFLCQLAIYFITGRTRPNIRFHRLENFRQSRVTFLVRNFDSVRYERPLVVSLHPKAAIESISVHGMPFCRAPMRDDGHGSILITFDKVPADATFSIEVKRKPADQVKLWLDSSSRLRPRSFDRKLEPFHGARRVSYFLARWLIGLFGFIAVFGIGLARDHKGALDELLVRIQEGKAEWSDWSFFVIAIPLALVVFVLVVPTGGKPIATGYLGWSGASNDWPPREGPST
jgi:hypothetical protein